MYKRERSVLAAWALVQCVCTAILPLVAGFLVAAPAPRCRQAAPSVRASPAQTSTLSTRTAGRRRAELQLSAARQAEAFSALVSWLEKAGGEVHSCVELTEDDAGAGCGLRAACDVRAGELLVRVPREAQLCHRTEEEGSESASLQAIMTTEASRKGRLPLAVKLMREKALDQAASRFGPYLASLPSSFPRHPLYFVEDLPEVQFVEPEAAAVERLREVLRLCDEGLCGGGGGGGGGEDLGLVVWAACAASSRAIRLPGALASSYADALVPVVDLV